jgi:hypothetical protein
MDMSKRWGRRLSGGGAFALLALAAVPVGAQCLPRGLPSPAPKDPLARALALQGTCPRSAQELGEALGRLGARLEPTIVNFAGFHNPRAGAFFLFEIASTGAPATFEIARGDLVFGHFTNATADGRLVSNRSGLVIEAIAWDPGKQFYNFYELVDGVWIYRGDSRDILDDIESLHRVRPAGAGPFGTKLRCSGCHLNGGLIQKELAPPHNDWFTRARPLPIGGLRPDAFVAAKLAGVVDTAGLSRLVFESQRRLADSPGYRKALAARSLQERLRPLFCPVEVNLVSESFPLDDERPTLLVPSEFFADVRLATGDIRVSRQAYDAGLRHLSAQLPGTPGRADADHPWLTPAKAQSDITAVEALVREGVIDAEFVGDVLAIDFTNPVFSPSRCGLLKLVPTSGDADFMPPFREALERSKAPAAGELLQNLTQAERTASFHAKGVAAFLTSCAQRASDPEAVRAWMRLLAQRRAEVGASEISKNPQGRILEDNFGRVVFPAVAPRPLPGRLAFNGSCDVE